MKKTIMRIKKAIQIKDDLIKYLTLKKILNYIIFEDDRKKKRIRTSSFPPVITFQPSAYCNTNCQLCPVGLGIKGPKKGFMKFATFKKIINDAKDYLFQIAFADWGEPFLNPDIFNMINYAENKKIMTHASTNLHFFGNEKEFMKLMNSGLSFLTVSLHGISQKTYEAYQPRKNFSQIIKRLQKLINLRNKMKSSKPRIDLAFSITKKNQQEIELMRQFAQKLNVDTDIYTASLNLRFYLGSKKIKPLVKEWAQNKKINMGDISALDKTKITDLYQIILEGKNFDYENIDKLELTAKNFCTDPWKTFTVNWDGTVSLCCVDYGKFIMGNAISESVIKIWNNKKYAKLRKYLTCKLDNKEIEFPCNYCIKY
ncbi:MAG: radical SAM/SPASM domain-containing protein [Promethearchaeota archaeon]|jgi:MoaA/NifB/PqqE/SkfB family radical SAM enzyme